MMLKHLRGALYWMACAVVAAAGCRVAAQPAAPVFLDSRDTIRMALPEPAPLASVQGRFILLARSGAIPVTRVLPASRPVRRRQAGSVVLAGSFQSALGGREWDPDGDVSRMCEVRPGVFELVVALPKGHFEYKIARNGSWGENYGAGFAPGGPNIPLDIARDGTIVRFLVDFNARTVRDSVRNAPDVVAPDAVPPKPAEPPGPALYAAVALRLARPVALRDVSAPLVLVEPDASRRTVVSRDVLSDPAFLYWKNDLGSRWTAAATTFKVWSPVAETADVLIYGAVNGKPARVIPMRRGSSGVWYARVAGDLHGTYYRYRFRSYGKTREAADINCFAASADATRSMVVDLNRARPAGWPAPILARRRSATDAVIYEISVRDFTVLPESGVSPQQRGRYLGLAQQGTRAPGGVWRTGLDHLLDLGITDVHLLPIQSSVTLGAHTGYGWGYATTLFNVPEEQYATTPGNPVNVIREVRQMVAGLHRAGLRVVMDVVYNHTWPPDGAESAFAQTVPFYYVRTDDSGGLLNESGVGNAMADERPMVRKYIRDSLLHWLRAYNIDGFRFDLLGMHYPESVADWAKALRAERPDVLLYGEPWTGGGPVHFGKGAQRGLGVAVFNDTFRGAVRGDTDGAVPGFAMGAATSFDLMRLVLLGSPSAGGGFTDSPQETVNYVSAHDNLCLWDKARRAMPGSTEAEQASAVKLAAASVLLSAGVPFLEGGAEIGRTKGGTTNSYNADDAVNGFHWSQAPAYAGDHAYVRGLISLRRALPAFRAATEADVRRAYRFLDPGSLPPQTVAYKVDGRGSRWRQALVVLHGGRESASMALPDGLWTVLADAERAGVAPAGTVERQLTLAPLSAYVLVR